MSEKEKSNLESTRMPVLQHLEELRRRILVAILAFIAGFGICSYFSKDIFRIMLLPLVDVLGKRKIVFTAPPEGFITYLKVAVLGGFFIASPIIFYELWKFVAPGLYKYEKKYVLLFVLSSSICFIMGAGFGYFVVFPFGFRFFITNFETEQITSMITMKEYLHFASQLLVAFGIVFELPVILFFLGRIGLVTSKMLWKTSRYAIVIIAIVAAVLTPPDVLSMTAMGVPLTLLYFLSILIVHLTGKQRVKKEENEKPVNE